VLIFVAEFPNSWTQLGLKKLSRKIDTDGSIIQKRGSAAGGGGLSERMRTFVMLNSWTLLSQDQPGTHRTVRHTAREIEIPMSMVFDVIHKDLKVTLYWKPRYFVIDI